MILTRVVECVHRVVVAGGTGRTGKAVVRYLANCEEIEVVGVVSRMYAGTELRKLLPDLNYSIPIFKQLEQALSAVKPTAVVDFTVPEAAVTHFRLCIDNKIHPIIGTTGFNDQEQSLFADLCLKHRVGGALIPNFALGMVVMKKALAEAAAIFPYVAVIDYYSDQKKEVPSGTSKQLAAELKIYDNYKCREIPVYSFRIPGQNASQQLKFGGQGETITISHDVSDRICFGLGVYKAVINIGKFNHLVTDLSDLL